MQMEISCGKRVFAVEVERGKCRQLSITVHPDMRITAKAPEGARDEAILARLRKRAAWIARQLDYFSQFQPPPPSKEFVGGETHRYLGRQYRLKVQQAEQARVRLVGRFFVAELPDPSDSGKIGRMMRAWYASRAREAIGKRIALHLPKFQRLGAPVPEVRYRRMRKRWGSCSTKGVIVLNTELAKVSVYCIDYVVVHELCHLLAPGHSPLFHRLLRRMLPDWEKRKKRLEGA